MERTAELEMFRNALDIADLHGGQFHPEAVLTPAGAVTGREQALRRLTEVAEWFKHNEPNSPIGFTLDEAARRARLAWPDLVAELVSDETARQTLLTSAGMKRPVAEQ